MEDGGWEITVWNDTIRSNYQGKISHMADSNIFRSNLYWEKEPIKNFRRLKDVVEYVLHPDPRTYTDINN